MDRPANSAPGGSSREGVQFESMGATPVERHRLRFGTRADLLAAIEQCRKQGHVRFRDGGRDFIGRIVRVAEKRLVIEVDAAADMPEKGWR